VTEHALQLQQLATAHGDGEHSIFSPSASSTWLHCAGSLIANLTAEDDAGYDAAWGTVMHAITEEWLRLERKPKARLGTTEFVERPGQWWGFFVEIDVHMLDVCQTCVDSVVLEPGFHFYERRVDFSRITPIRRQTGTADCIILQPSNSFHNDRELARMIVADWKGGKGVQVFAENNSQCLLYALGAFYEFEYDYYITEIEIRIEQPRFNHSDVWTITRERLLEFEAWARERAHAAWMLDAPRTAGAKQCRWCKVKADCAAYAKMLIDLSAGVFTDLNRAPSDDEILDFKEGVDIGLMRSPVEVYRLSVEQMVTLYAYRKIVEPWYKAVEQQLSKLASEGKPVPGMKLVESRSNRLFINEDVAVETLETFGVEHEQLVKTYVVSPAEAEDLLRAAGHPRKNIPNLLAGLVRKPPGKPTLVPITDKRPALTCITEGIFDVIDD
jgi:hypothetical protein